MESATWNGTPGEVVDSSGNGYSRFSSGATTSNASPAIAGNPGTCRYGAFNGSTAYLDLDGPVLPLTNKPTVSAWIRWGINPSTGNKWSEIVTNNEVANRDSGQFWLQHSASNTAFEFAVKTTNSRNWATSNVAPQQGVWTYVTGVYDGSTIKLYVNGALSDTVSQTGNLVASSSNYKLNIGQWANSGNTNRRFNGNIDEARIYNQALTPAQIVADMNATHPC
jgi:MSHA biogenesis protein MshQ